METVNFIGQPVEITAVYFKPGSQQARLESYPRRMVMDGREYTFMESGMRYLARQGQALVKLFDVSDGEREFRLAADESEEHWRLIGTRAIAF